MTTLFLSHPFCLDHDMGAGHPESPDRLRAIQDRVDSTDWGGSLVQAEATKAGENDILAIHPASHLAAIKAAIPAQGLARIDGDTAVNSASLDAALRAAGAGCQAVAAVMAGSHDNAFCAVRPPGHHAETELAMGFCLFNNVAIAAQKALASGAERIAIIDFDVHHGNGTVEIFQNRPEVLVCSSFQYPFYPGRYDRVDRPHIVLSPLAAGTGGAEMRREVEQRWTQAVRAHRPDFILVSAGFDAHRRDPLAGLNWEAGDYRWLTELILSWADKYCDGRVVSMLEGGYDLDGLSEGVAAHLETLAGLNG